MPWLGKIFVVGLALSGKVFLGFMWFNFSFLDSTWIVLAWLGFGCDELDWIRINSNSLAWLGVCDSRLTSFVLTLGGEVRMKNIFYI